MNKYRIDYYDREADVDGREIIFANSEDLAEDKFYEMINDDPMVNVDNIVLLEKL